MAVKPSTFHDEFQIRANIREIIRDNRKAKGAQFRSYIQFLLQLKMEIDGHLRSKGVTNDAIYPKLANRLKRKK